MNVLEAGDVGARGCQGRVQRKHAGRTLHTTLIRGPWPPDARPRKAARVSDISSQPGFRPLPTSPQSSSNAREPPLHLHTVGGGALHVADSQQIESEDSGRGESGDGQWEGLRGVCWRAPKRRVMG